jgi:hypothetical protein
MKIKTRLALIVTIAIAVCASLGVSVRLFAARPSESAQGKSPGAELCDGKRFPVALSPAQCCQDGNRAWIKAANSNIVVLRTYGPPCREDDGVSTNCGVGSEPFKPCAYGPCSAKNEWAIRGETANIFHPTSKPKMCGWSVTNMLEFPICNDPGGCGNLGGTRDFPEPYTNQTVYAGVPGTCPYTKCRKGGTPQ